MRNTILALFVSVASASCGKSDPPGGAPPKPPPPVVLPETRGVSGSAKENDRALHAGWGVAFWNENEKELVVGFLAAEPGEDKLKTIGERRDLFMGVFLDVPLVQFTIQFKDGNGKPDPAAPTFYRVLYHNFGTSPMTLNRSVLETDTVQVTGDLRAGGTVKGVLRGTDLFDVGDDKRTYAWDLKFNLDVR